MEYVQGLVQLAEYRPDRVVVHPLFLLELMGNPEQFAAVYKGFDYLDGTRAIASEPRTSPILLRLYAALELPALSWALLRNPALPADLAQHLHQIYGAGPGRALPRMDTGGGMQDLLVQTARADLSAEEVERLAGSEYIEVRVGIATRPCLPPKVLTRLRVDPSSKVRAAARRPQPGTSTHTVLLDPMTTAGQLRRLMQCGHLETGELMWLYAHRNMPVEYLEQLVAGEMPMAAALGAAMHPEVPEEVAFELARRGDEGVVQELLRHPRLLTKALVYLLGDARPMEVKRLLQRRDLTSAVIAALAQSAEWECRGVAALSEACAAETRAQLQNDVCPLVGDLVAGWEKEGG